MWELDCKESWAPKNWCFGTVVLEKTLESPLDRKEIQPARPKGNQSWIFIGRADAEAETPILWPPDAKNWLIWKDLDARNDWRREEKGTTEDKMVGWHHQLNEHEFEKAPGVGDGQGSLACCSPWDRKELEMTEQLNWTECSSVFPFGTSSYCCLVTKSCPTLYNSMNSSLPGSFVHGIFQARTLELVAISFSRGSSRPRDGIHTTCIGR